MRDLTNRRFDDTDYTGTRFHGVEFVDVTISDAWIDNLDISGHIGRLTVNGVDVVAFVERELDARHPERQLLKPSEPEGVVNAWQSIESFAARTIERARMLPSGRLDESVNGEWSFLETLRHLVYATDRWIGYPVLGRVPPFHRLGLPNTPHDEVPLGSFDLAARPSLDEVLDVRRERMEWVSALADGVEADELGRVVESPNGGETTVLACLQVVFNEEWWHDQYANRDLSALETR